MRINCQLIMVFVIIIVYDNALGEIIRSLTMILRVRILFIGGGIRFSKSKKTELLLVSNFQFSFAHFMPN